MNTRTCKHCGWVYPATWPGKTCKFCHKPMESGICPRCGKYSDKLNRANNYCKDCSTAAYNAWRKKIVSNNIDAFEQWKEVIKKIPTPYKPLTEEQWLEACRHFGGCAYCGKPTIEARSMFIHFRDGGRYCNWNIIPACEKCEAAYKATDNPFLRLDERLNRNSYGPAATYGFSKEKLLGIVDYLRSKIDE